MRWEEWEPIYLEIVREMGYSVEEDLRAAHILNEMLASRALTIHELKEMIKENDTAIIFGAGPSLTLDIQEFIELDIIDKVTVFVADGASRAFLDKKLRMDFIVTDLDGGDDILIESSRRCLAMIVHAHGDNIIKIRSLLPRLYGRILGTVQCEPFGNMYNFGGFTDGDRAVFLSDILGFEKIVLAGMDFGEEIGQYSKNYNMMDERWVKIKKKKLSIGKTLLELYSSTSDKKLYNVTSRGEEIKGFKKTSFRELATLI
ncbi:MAG: DUF115 domain-containing protein [Aigarchaeota archaeon]|nr:DUF115 domain-containing protein [Aigarchaeota archaeon]MDW7986063.1 DUF115 domain-containing protein [Nitrososphaerota archaeon]